MKIGLYRVNRNENWTNSGSKVCGLSICLMEQKCYLGIKRRPIL